MLQRMLQGSRNIADVRATLVDFLGDTISRTDRMTREVEAAGQPAVEDGEALARELREKLREFRPAFVQARSRAAALPDDPAAFARGAQEIGSAIQKAGTDIEGEFNALQERYDVPELDKAFDEATACQSLS